MLITTIVDYVMNQVGNHRPYTTEAWVKLQASPCDICGGQSGTGMVSSLSTLGLLSQCYSTNDSYSSIYNRHYLISEVEIFVK